MTQEGCIMKRLFFLTVFVSFLLTSVSPVFAGGEITAAAGQDLLKEDQSAVQTSAQITASAAEEPIYSNFNTDPLKNHPSHYKLLNIREDVEPVLVQRIRTNHWNNGKGALPGTISVFENGVKIGTWQAVGRSAYGTPNVYWDALVDFILYPGSSYYVSVSDVDSMSYNEASGNCGMFELYGIRPAPEGYVSEKQKSESAPQITISNQTENPVQSPQSGRAESQAPAYVPNWSASPAPILSGALPATVSVGYTFRMGRYEQDGKTSNGAEGIEWRVLAVQNDRALIISTDQLEMISWSDMHSTPGWGSSTMRSWLNGDFYRTAFTDSERAVILEVTNANPGNPQTGATGEGTTKDHIFLLNLDEAGLYFKSDKDRACSASPYAADRMAAAWNRNVAADDFSRPWLLRSPGEDSGIRADVYSSGEVDHRGAVCGMSCDKVFFGLRPAFWMKIDKPACFRVKYFGDQCLAAVPTDEKCYKKGDKVTVLFEPVEYVMGYYFNGWDRTGDGTADHGYYYNSFTMPDHDVELHAICYLPYQQLQDQQYRDQGQYDYREQYYQDQYGDTTRPDPVDPTGRDSALYPDYGIDFDYDYDYSYVPGDGQYPPYNFDPGGQWWGWDGVG